MDNFKEIGGTKYVFEFLPAEDSVHVQVAVAKVIGEPLFKAFMSVANAAGSEEEREAAQAQAGGVAIGLMLSKMEPNELIATMNKVFKFTSIGGVKASCSLNDFRGKNKEMWQVFIAGLRYNYSDFIPESLSGFVRDQAQKLNP